MMTLKPRPLPPGTYSGKLTHVDKKGVATLEFECGRRIKYQLIPRAAMETINKPKRKRDRDKAREKRVTLLLSQIVLYAHNAQESLTAAARDAELARMLPAIHEIVNNSKINDEARRKLVSILHTEQIGEPSDIYFEGDRLTIENSDFDISRLATKLFW